METGSKMAEKSAASGESSSTEPMEKVEALSEDIKAGHGSSNENIEEGQGSGIGEQNECRICQEEDYLHKLEAPCHCNGTLKPYEAGYTMVTPPPPPSAQTENVTVGISRDGTYITMDTDQAGLQAGQRTAQIEAAAEFLRQQHAMLANGGKYFNAGVLCRIAAVICLTFLVMKDIYYIYENGEDSDLLTVFCNRSEGDLAAGEVSVAASHSMT
ncbi:uncharacterized protein LOC103933093 [Pyrus x bretschneideri]|uniref:uncharacterized protein LOC103933093 n=1 Tax=Pyrus x bretschneideri TaxID=225117 RepID=UPI00202DE643|nr:uncharacterized protein LOC103933093 [Pyrus x bretschneideri]